MAADGPILSLPPEPVSTVSGRTWAMAAVAVLLVLGIAAVATLHRGSGAAGAVRGPDAYAPSLPISGITMTEATNGASGKELYVDGTVSNSGQKVVTGVVVQVSFNTGDAAGPHRETLPMSLVRTREPYVDLQPVSADPIKPGEHKNFRLIFESVPQSWDVQPPAIQVVHADLR